MPLLTRSTRSAVVALALSLGLFAPAARAASVSHTLTYPLTQYLNGGTLAMTSTAPLPQFNLAGQCLTSVCVRLDGGLFGEIGFENLQPFPVTVNVSFTGLITLRRPDTSPIVAVQPLATTTDNLPVYDGTLDYLGLSGRSYTGVNPTKSDSLCLAAPGDLALFTGAGSISLPMSAMDLSSQSGASSWSIGPRAYASVTVTYNYQECTTPAEPTTWGRIKRNYR